MYFISSFEDFSYVMMKLVICVWLNQLKIRVDMKVWTVLLKDIPSIQTSGYSLLFIEAMENSNVFV